MKGKESPQNMRKALAQNPNLLRTLIGMGLTLIFLLAYAVYGATIETEVYIYESNSIESQVSLESEVTVGMHVKKALYFRTNLILIGFFEH